MIWFLHLNIDRKRDLFEVSSAFASAFEYMRNLFEGNLPLTHSEKRVVTHGRRT